MAHGPDRRDVTAAHFLLGLARARLAQDTSPQRVPEIWRDLQRAYDIFEQGGDLANAIAVADHDIPANRPLTGLSDLSGRALRLASSGTLEQANIVMRFDCTDLM